MMIQFEKNINLERICSLIQNSRGNVYLQCCDGSSIDLKTSPAIPNDLKAALYKMNRIKLHVVEAADCFDFTNYMIHAFSGMSDGRRYEKKL